MKTLIRSVCFVAVSCVLCSTAFSNTEDKVAKNAGEKRVRNLKIYLVSSVSAIPQPIDRFNGPIPTTATPLLVIGHH